MSTPILGNRGRAQLAVAFQLFRSVPQCFACFAAVSQYCEHHACFVFFPYGSFLPVETLPKRGLKLRFGMEYLDIPLDCLTGGYS